MIVPALINFIVEQWQLWRTRQQLRQADSRILEDVGISEEQRRQEVYKANLWHLIWQITRGRK